MSDGEPDFHELEPTEPLRCGNWLTYAGSRISYGTGVPSVVGSSLAGRGCELPVRVVDDDESAGANSNLLRPPKAES
jgi:hypothetical protein